jgi:peroxiredoxin Q/BCP
MQIKIGDKAPAFSLSDQEGNIHTLAEYKGKWVLLYFYPKDDTPGCTTEACTIRDSYSSFGDSDTIVLGVSKDSVASHGKFAKKYKLPFPILSDESKETMKAYGAWGKKKFLGKEYMGVKRTSFLIDKVGKIAKIYETVKPPKHAQEVLSDVQEKQK